MGNLFKLVGNLFLSKKLASWLLKKNEMNAGNVITCSNIKLFKNKKAL